MEAAALLVVLGHTRELWASEQTVPNEGAAIYCTRLVPPPAVRWCGSQLHKRRDHLMVACQTDQSNREWKLTLLCHPSVLTGGTQVGWGSHDHGQE